MHRALVRHHYPFKVNTLAMSDSYIWLGTESGLIRCEHGDDDFSDCRIIDSGIRNTTSLLLDDDGSGLILTSNGQLHRYEKGNFAETPQTFTGYPKILQSDAVHQKSLVIMCSDSQCTQKRQYSCSLDGHQCEESTTGVFTVGDL
jgi:ligand-binding sensor domain-containing protein